MGSDLGSVLEQLWCFVALAEVSNKERLIGSNLLTMSVFSEVAGDSLSLVEQPNG